MSRYCSVSVAGLCAVLMSCLACKPAPAEDAPAAAADVKNTPPLRQINEGYRLAPKAFRAAAEKVRNSIVRIETYGGLAGAIDKRGRGKVPGIGRPGEGPTTGLVVSPDGYIITSTFNFLTRPPIITVTLADGSRHVAKLLGRDESRKLCVLKVETAGDLPVPEFVDPDTLRVGQWAIAVGVGFGGEEASISAGIISARNRISGRAVQTDANTSPANYGGPLVDIEGRIIGVCVPLSARSSGAGSGVEWYDSGIGFAVPLYRAERLLEALKAGKTVRPAALGVQVDNSRPDEFDGVEIKAVRSGSAAEKAGIKPGDRIIALGDRPTRNMAELRIALGRYIAGETAQLRLEREGKTQELSVTFEAGSTSRAAPKTKLLPRIKKPR